MNKNDISTFISFNFWANERILTACQQLTTDQFTRTVTPDPGWSSLRGILVHTLDTEYGWRTAMQAHKDEGILQETDFSDVASLKTRWNIEKAIWLDFASSLDDERLNQGYGKKPQTSPKIWQTIMHVVTHGVQHRSEAAYILTGYGQSPGELDFAIFLKQENRE